MATISYDEAERLALGGNLVDAEKICEALLLHFPDHYSTLYLLGSIKFMTGHFEKSRDLCIKLIEIDDSNADVFNILGMISADHDNDQEQAAEWFLSAIERKSDHTKALTNLGNTYFKLKRFEDARDYYQQATSDERPYPDAINGLAMLETLLGANEQAVNIYRSALEHSPDAPNILGNLISALYNSAEGKEEAVSVSMRVAQLSNPGVAAIPAYACANSFCLWDIEDTLFPYVIPQLDAAQKTVSSFLLSHLPLLSANRQGVNNQVLLDIHRHTAKAIKASNQGLIYTDHSEAFEVEGRMRIGFISSDFYRHVVGKFVIELIKHIDKTKFELFLYSGVNSAKADDITDLYRDMAEHFADVSTMGDEEVATLIHGDGVQVLIDLNGYTANTRVPVLVYRPAPIQISYLGYPFTSGFDEIDYVISDPWLDGPKNAQYCTEKPLRLAQSFITIGAVPKLDINPIMPRLRHGKLTFGSLNNAYKLNRKTIEIWSRILQAVPDSRLYLNHPNYSMAETRSSIRKELAKYGISKDRIDIDFAKNTSTPDASHLAFYNEIDIALDAMPLTGGTTTIEALLMGVPVITLVGETHAQRLSYSIIKNVGIDLDDCIAFSEEEYVQRAIALANSRERQITLRQQIAPAMRQGILGDSTKFASQLEHAFKQAWDMKFPASPIASVLAKKNYQPLPVGNNCQLVVNDNPSDIAAFVLHEQGRWFENESQFLCKFAQHFEFFWDFSEDAGVYVVPFASAQAGSKGRSVAIRPNGIPSQLIKKSIEHNQLRNLSVILKPDLKNTPDIVRFSYDYNDKNEIELTEILDQLESFSPLVLVSLRNGLGKDGVLPFLLMSRGYQPYRLLPGFELLVPHQVDDTVYASDINMFFCKDERARQLQKIGLLCFDVVNIDEMPEPNSIRWVQAIENMPYASKHVKAWLEMSQTSKWDDMYRLVMNLYADAKPNTLNSAQRCAKIKLAQTVITLLMREEATVSRALTGIRLMLDAGRREQALEWAGLLVNQLQSQSGKILDEPFLAPEICWEQSEISEDEALWVSSVAAIIFERYRNFSSWFDSENSLKQWEKFAELPFSKELARHMVDLLTRKVDL